MPSADDDAPARSRAEATVTQTRRRTIGDVGDRVVARRRGMPPAPGCCRGWRCRASRRAQPRLTASAPRSRSRCRARSPSGRHRVPGTCAPTSPGSAQRRHEHDEREQHPDARPTRRRSTRCAAKTSRLIAASSRKSTLSANERHRADPQGDSELDAEVAEVDERHRHDGAAEREVIGQIAALLRQAPRRYGGRCGGRCQTRAPAASQSRHRPRPPACSAAGAAATSVRTATAVGRRHVRIAAAACHRGTVWRSPRLPAAALSLIRDAEIEQTLERIADPLFRAAGVNPATVQDLHRQRPRPERLRRRRAEHLPPHRAADRARHRSTSCAR